MNKTGISWTDYSANPLRYRDATGRVVWACAKLSPGCANCYAARLAERMDRGGPFNAGLTEQLEVYLDERELHRLETSSAISGKRVFVGDMTDVFGHWVPRPFQERLFQTMAMRPDVTFQLLTKRPEQLYLFADWWVSRPLAPASVPAHIWLGVSVEDQQRADERIPVLAETPAAVRFLSCEPLLGPLDLRRYLEHPRGGVRPDWLIVGGESGGPPERALVDRVVLRGLPNHYYPKPEAIRWVRSLRELCLWTGVAFFFKQWGGALPSSGGHALDGQTWQQFPLAAVPA